jgi:hypothetical protein
MQLVAKNILPEKFWIIENSDLKKLGTIQVGNQAVRVVIDGKNYVYSDFNSALDELSISTSEEPLSTESEKDSYNVNNYPVKNKPYNITYDAALGASTYTKSEKSTCYHAAGYYIIGFDFAWAQAYCPKVTTLKQNKFKGPYTSQIEMKEQLRLNNAKNKN